MRVAEVEEVNSNEGSMREVRGCQVRKVAEVRVNEGRVSMENEGKLNECK